MWTKSISHISSDDSARYDLSLTQTVWGPQVVSNHIDPVRINHFNLFCTWFCVFHRCSRGLFRAAVVQIESRRVLILLGQSLKGPLLFRFWFDKVFEMAFERFMTLRKKLSKLGIPMEIYRCDGNTHIGRKWPIFIFCRTLSKFCKKWLITRWAFLGQLKINSFSDD